MSDQIASMFARVGADVSDFSKGMNTVKSNMSMAEKSSAAMGVAFKAAFAIGVTAAVGFTAALGKSISLAADFEQGAANIGAVFGDAAPPIEKVQGLISDLSLDPSLVVTSQEAAAGIEMLAKNGLDWIDIANGAARSSVLLSNATGADLAKSADITTNALGIFGLEVKNLDSVVATFTNAANMSQFAVEDWGYVLANAGPAANAMGWAVEELFAAVTLVSSGFASGREAGTSFEYLIKGLTPSTDVATKAMKELGLITGEGANQFFNADGTAKVLEDSISLLQGAFGGLSVEQRMAYSEAIFGNTAYGALEGVLNLNLATLDELIPTMTDFSAVEAGAAMRTDTFKASLEMAQGVIESLSIGVGQKFLPVLRPMVDKFSELATTHGPAVIDFFGGLAEKMVDGIQRGTEWATRVLPPLWQGFLQVGDSIQNLTKPITDTIGKWMSWKDVLAGLAVFAIPTLIGAVTGLVSFLTPVIALVGAIAIASAALRAAWDSNFKGIRDIAGDVFETFTEWVKTYSGIWKGDWGKTLSYIKNNTGEAFSIMWREVKQTWSVATNEVRHVIETWLSQTGIKIENRAIAIKADFERMWEWIKKYFREGKETAIEWLDKLFGWFKPNEWIDKGRDIIQGLWDGAKQVWQNFKNWWSGLWSTLTGTVDVQMKIGSPSKEMEDRGRWAVEGFALGAKEATPMAIDAMSGLAYGAINAVPQPTGNGTDTSRIEELLMILINELRNKNMSVTVNGGSGGDSLSTLTGFKAGMRGA